MNQYKIIVFISVTSHNSGTFCFRINVINNVKKLKKCNNCIITNKWSETSEKGFFFYMFLMSNSLKGGKLCFIFLFHIVRK